MPLHGGGFAGATECKADAPAASQLKWHKCRAPVERMYVFRSRTMTDDEAAHRSWYCTNRNSFCFGGSQSL